MPIIIKDYNWKETENTITIDVPLKIGASHKADIFNSRRYVKITYEQYLFEVLLMDSTDIYRNRFTITDTNVIVELFKSENKVWGSLEPDITKYERQNLKQILIEEEHKRYQQECEKNKSRKAELKRVAVKEQISLDTVERKAIEKIKTTEKSEALGNIGDWVHRKSTNIIATKTTRVGNNQRLDSKESCSHVKRIPTTTQITNTNNQNLVPLPRQTRTLEIQFTPREFPTPSRESKLAEENEWLKKQAEARRSAGFISDDIRPEERNPQFLKAKGDEFMKTHNYLGAISAYSFGIKLSVKYADLYIARSEAHLAIGNYHKTAQDCSAALDLLKPEVPSNLQERATCIGRRGIALCKLDLLIQGVGELKASLRLIENKIFNEELLNFEKLLQQKEDESD